MRTIALFLTTAALLVACGSNNSTADMTTVIPDLASSVPHDMVAFSCCGHPGDKGNALGVGQYCAKLDDCMNNSKAVICTTIASATTFFCTFPCTAGDAGNVCGDGASCICQGNGQCGCVPDTCAANLANPACM